MNHAPNAAVPGPASGAEAHPASGAELRPASGAERRRVPGPASDRAPGADSPAPDRAASAAGRASGAASRSAPGATAAAAAPRAARRTGPRIPRRTGPRALVALLVATGLALLSAPPAQADSIRAQQWALDALHTDEAWRTTKGEGVTVAVLDTGVDGSHPDLEGRVLAGKDLIGFGAGKGDRAWARHGTAMAGIIAGHGNGPGRADGVVGIAPEAKILPVRVILEGGDPARKRARSTRGNALAQGIRWAADHGADVINLSLGDDSKSAHPEPAEDAAVQYALAKGAVVVASAGNSGEEGDHISYPAAYPGVIAVAAVDSAGTHASFSTSRWYATVSAPGVDVIIADPDRRYYEGWGTSAASAFVSGAAALVRSAHPDLTPAQVKKLLADTARDAPEGGRDDDRGYGFVDPAAAIEAGGKLRPAGLRPALAPHGKQYFGPGPTPLREDDEPAGWLAPVTGGVGALLLAGAVALWRASQTTGPRNFR